MLRAAEAYPQFLSTKRLPQPYEEAASIPQRQSRAELSMIQSPDTQYPTRLKPQATVLAAAQIDGSFSFSLDLQASLVLIKKSGRLCVQDCADVLEHRPQATHVIRLRAVCLVGSSPQGQPSSNCTAQSSTDQRTGKQ